MFYLPENIIDIMEKSKVKMDGIQKKYNFTTTMEVTEISKVALPLVRRQKLGIKLSDSLKKCNILLSW